MIVKRSEKYGLQGELSVWRGIAEAAYERYQMWDGEEQPEPVMPEPSFVLSPCEAAQLVVAVLRGHDGAVGPMGAPGPTGMSA